ncbi:MAG TPA: CoA transferase [Candidatus Binataceae bacterium]|jgi:crotonobetainyl-CoA:carnitine CoA-transferase CaiB-like acyl-CoA transferase|nr:CoA transferase [Candidatus Binataceae bacterium]
MTAERPLSGVRICDFTWAMAAPMATRILADFGATVVRIEPHNRYDAARTQPPFLNNEQGAENSAMWSNCDAGKLSIVLDLARPSARRVVLDLVRWAGVAMESFSPGTMRKWELDYESLRQVRPDLIMLSSSLMGQDGPMADYAGWGYMGAAMAGFHQVTGWTDRDPSGPFHSYTDYVVPRMTALALIAALDHRRLTGEGQFIDFSQVEAAIHFLAPAYLDHSVNGRAMPPMGNRDLNFAPHGVYPCAGDDRWIAVVCENDAQWQALCKVLQLPELKRDPRFTLLSARLAHAEELDRIVAGWTSTLDQYQAEAMLQAAGVPSSAVQNSAELSQDPQLAHRGHFVQVNHPLHGTIFVESPPIRLSLTPGSIQSAAPILGGDTQHVLADILGYNEEQITELAADGALG